MGEGRTVARRTGRLTILFGSTIALSALLLFTVEPLVGRLALPVFGGTPGVWATTLAFFQAVLLLGYLYGHVLLTRVGPRAAARVHAVVACAAAVAALAGLGLRATDLPVAGLPDALGVLVLLAALVGLPAFALSATTPLVSAWYTGSTGRDPYWLYAVSNAGSFVGLLAYPFVVEPALGLAAQRTGWAAGVSVLAILLVGAAFVAIRAPSEAGQDDVDSVVSARDPLSGGALRRVRWLLLAAVPAGLLSAVTNVIATDVVSAPLLWVVPLAIYLATFVVAFSARGGPAGRVAVVLAPAAVTLLWVPTGSVGGWPIIPLVALEWGSLAIVALALHSRLALDRPPADRLTEFYLVLSTGGVIGGAFVGLVAPAVFPGIWELPILLVAGLLALAWSLGPLVPVAPEEPAPALAFDPRPLLRGAPRRLGPYAVVALALALALVGSHSLASEAAFRWLLVGGLVLLAGGQPWFLAATTGLVLVLATFVLPDPAVLRARSFFGVTEVLQPVGLGRTVLMNGTTVHGGQWDDAARRTEPVGYYVRSGPLGEAFAVLDALRPAPRSVGVVGLGAGGIATYERTGDRMTYYEIDPIVVAVATDPRYFTFLADAPAAPAIVLGDARRSIDRVPAGTHDVLVLDAFSSDAIPAHLLTREAIADDRRVLRPGGVLLVHVSNRYYDLAPAVSAAARPLGLTVLDRTYDPGPAELDAGASPSEWVAATDDPDVVAGLAGKGWRQIRDDVAPMTDDHPDLLRFLRL